MESLKNKETLEIEQMLSKSKDLSSIIAQMG